MRLSVSNLAWPGGEEDRARCLLSQYKFTGIELAPTKVFPERPYAHLIEARALAADLGRRGLCVPSLQSIWYGRGERLFGTEEEREALFRYTVAAMDFAVAVGAKNLVFGSPRNRRLPEDATLAETVGVPFFVRLAREAEWRGVRLGLEANPKIYGTNYLTHTEEVFALAERVASLGLGVNLDLGTMLVNGELAALLHGRGKWISHVHLSEPQLAPIVPHALHREVAAALREEGYAGWVSVEMKQTTLDELARVLSYVREVFDDRA